MVIQPVFNHCKAVTKCVGVISIIKENKRAIEQFRGDLTQNSYIQQENNEMEDELLENYR